MMNTDLIQKCLYNLKTNKFKTKIMATYLKTCWGSENEIKNILGVAKLSEKTKRYVMVFRQSISTVEGSEKIREKFNNDWIEATKEEYDELMKIAATNINEANNDE